MLKFRFSKFESLLTPRITAFSKSSLFWEPNGKASLKHLRQKKDSLLLLSSSYLADDIELHLIWTQLLQISQHIALAFPQIVLMHILQNVFSTIDIFWLIIK